VKNLNSKFVTVIAILICIASVGRTIFAGIPNFQPASFIIIMAGVVLGVRAGWITGVGTALVSNIFLGQGPWTLFQMIAWGLMGLTAGLLRKVLKYEYINIVFSFSWGFLFGFITDIWTVLVFVKPLSFAAIAGVYLTAFPFNLMHALCNALLVYIFSDRFIKIFERLNKKYDISECGND
jgi:energy-coupling factor transport system substrate-specific component